MTIDLPELPETPDGVLPMWAIYDHPADFPQLFVARLWHIVPGVPDPVNTEIVIGCPELAGLRKIFDRWGMVCLTRNDDDEAQIVETWF
ncbi:MAG TPA: hypothetical protein VNM71_12310 [Steroidobacteraceae bacterium]|nr:hypothetical protein [Steroidobacteraceae bacterium]